MGTKYDYKPGDMDYINKQEIGGQSSDLKHRIYNHINHEATKHNKRIWDIFRSMDAFNEEDEEISLEELKTYLEE